MYAPDEGMKTNSNLFSTGTRIANKAKQEGTTYETAVARYLAEETGAWVERRALSGTADKGDLIGDGVLADWCLEAKNHKSIDL